MARLELSFSGPPVDGGDADVEEGCDLRGRNQVVWHGTALLQICALQASSSAHIYLSTPLRNVAHRCILTGIGLGVYAGLRVSEMAHLEHRDVDLIGRVLYVRQGKGGKDRALPIHDVLADILFRCGHTMTAQVGHTISNRITRIYRDAGIHGHRPHDLRATFATELIRHEVDLITVRNLLGHASVKTTERYVLPDERGVELVNRLSFAA